MDQIIQFDLDEFIKGKTYAVDTMGRMYTYEQHNLDTGDLSVKPVNSDYVFARNLDGSYFNTHTQTANDLVALVPKTKF